MDYNHNNQDNDSSASSTASYSSSNISGHDDDDDKDNHNNHNKPSILLKQYLIHCVEKQSVSNELTERIEMIKIHNMIISLGLNENNTDPKYTQESYEVEVMKLKSLEMSLKENNQEINKLDRELQE